MNQEELDKIIERHSVWLIAEESGGVFADLSGLDLTGLSLKGKNLSHIDLSNSNLTGVDMSESDLSNSDLSCANLSGANLSKSNLSMAYVSEANLSKANMSWVNLHCADLSNANLTEILVTGADFSGANLNGTIFEHNTEEHFKFNRHPAKYYSNGLLTVGCFTYHISYWLENFREIGKAHKYSEEEIEMYGNFIKKCLKKE